MYFTLFPDCCKVFMRRIFSRAVTTSVCIEKLRSSMFEWFYTDLGMVFCIYKPFFSYHDFIPNAKIIIDSCGVFNNYVFYICICFHLYICIQLSKLLIGRIVPLPKTNWLGLFCLVRWYLLLTTKDAAARIPIHGSASCTYFPCRL